MKNPAISVIIPVYKAEKYLSSCLDSILAQTFEDFELICINDGSPDNCSAILKKYAEKDSRIYVFNQKNRGQSVARNRGIESAKGEYLFFVDSDDKIHAQTLEIFYHIAKKTNAPITVSNTFLKKTKLQRFDKNYVPIEVMHQIHQNPIKDLLHTRYLSSLVWNKLYARDVFENWRFIEGIVFEDWPLITCLFSEISFYASVDIPLYFYNDADVSTVRSSFTSKKIADYMIGIDFVYQYYQQSEKKKYWRLIQKYRIKQSLKMILDNLRKSDNKELIFHFKKEYDRLSQSKIFRFWDFSLKSKIRLFNLFYSIKRRNKICLK